MKIEYMTSQVGMNTKRKNNSVGKQRGILLVVGDSQEGLRLSVHMKECKCRDLGREFQPISFFHDGRDPMLLSFSTTVMG